jgi:hypothetical protein
MWETNSLKIKEIKAKGKIKEKDENLAINREVALLVINGFTMIPRLLEEAKT